jgi:RNA-directed DNA polymerase
VEKDLPHDRHLATGLPVLLRSRSNTLVSVRRVAQLNAGRKTAGIDGKTALLAPQKAELVDWVQQRSRSWTARAVKRVFIPKANGKQRPLGIPTDPAYGEVA